MHENDSIEMEESAHEPPMPELKLALAIVRVALFDCRCGSRKQYRYESDSIRNYHETKADDARDFLLNRLNEEDNRWGQILKVYGYRPLTEARIAQIVRVRPKRGRVNQQTLELA